MSLNNVKKTIGWADYTWNYVTGCKRGCPYCYARQIWYRFNKQPFTDIISHPNRLEDPYKVKKPSKIFVGSMTDLCYWSEDQIFKTLAMCERVPQHTYMFLTKDYKAYDAFVWPPNTMQGLTMTCDQNEAVQTEIIEGFMRLQDRRRFFSLEPLMGNLKVNIGSRVELVIVGAMTGTNATKPTQEWVDSVKKKVAPDRLYWKRNIQKMGLALGY
jgi:protein gp37